MFHPLYDYIAVATGQRHVDLPQHILRGVDDSDDDSDDDKEEDKEEREMFNPPIDGSLSIWKLSNIAPS
jgi:hypothetical protein